MKNSRAFSLTEVLVATAILALFSIPLFQTLNTTQRGTLLLQEDVPAVLLGLELLDQLKLIPLRYLEGFGKKTLVEGEQPLIEYFRRQASFAALRANPQEVQRAEALLYLELSPLPENTQRELEIEETRDGFARVHALVRYRNPALREREAWIERRVSGLLVEGR